MYGNVYKTVFFIINHFLVVCGTYKIHVLRVPSGFTQGSLSASFIKVIMPKVCSNEKLLTHSKSVCKSANGKKIGRFTLLDVRNPHKKTFQNLGKCSVTLTLYGETYRLKIGVHVFNCMDFENDCPICFEKLTPDNTVVLMRTRQGNGSCVEQSCGHFLCDKCCVRNSSIHVKVPCCPCCREPYDSNAMFKYTKNKKEACITKITVHLLPDLKRFSSNLISSAVVLKRSRDSQTRMEYLSDVGILKSILGYEARFLKKEQRTLCDHDIISASHRMAQWHSYFYNGEIYEDDILRTLKLDFCKHYHNFKKNERLWNIRYPLTFKTLFPNVCMKMDELFHQYISTSEKDGDCVTI